MFAYIRNVFSYRNLIVVLSGLVMGLTVTACSNEAGALAVQAGLNPPFDVSEVRQENGHLDRSKLKCGDYPPPMVDLSFQSIYGNLTDNSSIIDPDAYEAYNTALAPVRSFELGLVSQANRYVRSNPPRPDVAQCVLAWLHGWAEEDALLGKANHTGEFVRKWTLATIANVFVQIRDEPSLDKGDVRDVRKWISRVAYAVESDFDRNPDKRSRQNNHLYWAAWAVASAGMALNDQGMFDWAMDKARFGVMQIQKDGTLPMEMIRGPKAFNYHVYAAIPLFMLAEAGALNGVDLYEENDGALHRLATRILKSLDDPEYFERKTGEPQDTTRTVSSSNLVWLEVYNRRYPGKRAEEWLEKYRPLRQSRVGGDATLLYSGGRE